MRFMAEQIAQMSNEDDADYFSDTASSQANDMDPEAEAAYEEFLRQQAQA